MRHTPTADTMMTTIMPTLVTRMDMAILTATDALTTVIAATIRPIAGLMFYGGYPSYRRAYYGGYRGYYPRRAYAYHRPYVRAGAYRRFR